MDGRPSRLAATTEPGLQADSSAARAGNATQRGRPGGQSFGRNRHAAAVASAVGARIELRERTLHVVEVGLCLLDQGRDLRALERNRGALGIVLVVDVRVGRRRDNALEVGAQQLDAGARRGAFALDPRARRPITGAARTSRHGEQCRTQCDDSSVSQTYRVTVRAVNDLNARMRRVTVGSDSLVGFAPWPGQDVVLHLTHEGAGVRRRYTVRNHDPVAHTFDLDFVRHGHGPGALWAENARSDDEVEIFGPRGKVAVSNAGWQLLAGDESAIPAIAEIVQALPEATVVTALIEVADAGDEQPIEASAALDLRWIHRGSAAAGTGDVLDRAFDEVRIPAEGRHVYLFGESRQVRRLRELGAARGLRLGEVSAKGYWNLDRSSRE